LKGKGLRAKPVHVRKVLAGQISHYNEGQEGGHTNRKRFKKRRLGDTQQKGKVGIVARTKAGGELGMRIPKRVK